MCMYMYMYIVDYSFISLHPACRGHDFIILSMYIHVHAVRAGLYPCVYPTRPDANNDADNNNASCIHVCIYLACIYAPQEERKEGTEGGKVVEPFALVL